jgi:magnesium chelatase family protein
MLATIPSATVDGVDGRSVRVEVHVSTGLPGFTLVGLPDASCREARDRVRAAMLSTEIEWPQKRITVNLAPTTLRKTGSALDLPIAVGLMVASGTVPAESVVNVGFIGELGLDGSVRHVAGVLALVDALSCAEVVVPARCATGANLEGRHLVRPVRSLAEVVAALRGTPNGRKPRQAPPVCARTPTLPTSGGSASVGGLSRSLPPSVITC